MNSHTRTILIAMALLSCAMFVGCREHMPHSFTVATGDLQRVHAEPAEGGYYTNWDPYAAEVEVKPVVDTNPVMTQHVLIATVRDKDGKPLPNRRVEWILTGDSVGTIVEVDESGWRASRGYKIDDHYAVTHTNNFEHVLTRGNDDPDDDIYLEVGQTWCVISSPTEGASHVVVYAPGIYNWDKHKVFVTKNWYDVTWDWPGAATNRVGSDHTFTTKVMKYSDSTPLQNYEVTYKISDGPAASFAGSNSTTQMVKTNSQGLATVTLRQASAVEGTNNVEIQIVRPGNIPCCEDPALIATGYTRKTWVAPQLSLTKSAPATARIGDTFSYDMQVGNPSNTYASNVMVTDDLPDGLEYVSSSPNAQMRGRQLTWSLGSMDPNETRTINVTVKGNYTGKFDNCAIARADLGLEDTACASTVISAPALALSKEAPSEILICDQIPYTITITNTGDASATNVEIRDDFPSGMKTLEGQEGKKFAIGTLNPGESRQVTFNTTVSDTGRYVNTAMASCDLARSNEASAKTMVRQPMLVMTKMGPQQRYLGLPASFEISLTNKGDTAARQVQIVDSLPSGMTFISADQGGTLSGSDVIWNIGDLAINQTKTVSVKVRVDKVGTLHNTARASGVCADAATEVTTAVTGIPAILLECIDTADPILVGENETYIITVTNQGTAEDTNIVIQCMLPAEQEFVSGRGPTDIKAEGRKVWFAPLSRLAPKDKATFHVVVRGNRTGDVRFGVKLTSDQMTSPASETESTRIYE